MRCGFPNYANTPRIPRVYYSRKILYIQLLRTSVGSRESQPLRPFHFQDNTTRCKNYGYSQRKELRINYIFYERVQQHMSQEKGENERCPLLTRLAASVAREIGILISPSCVPQVESPPASRNLGRLYSAGDRLIALTHASINSALYR